MISRGGDIECGFIEPSVWGEQKTSLLPWVLIDAWNPFNSVDHLDYVPVRFFSCRGSPHCNAVWEVPAAGVGSIQSNILKHLKIHTKPFLANTEVKEDIKTERPSQYTFISRWLASGLPHFQVTRDSRSGLYHYLRDETTCPVSSPNTFDKHRDLFLDRSVENMLKALEGNVGFILGDSSPDRLKREWISFGVTFIDSRTGDFHYMPLGLNQAKGRLDAPAYETHHNQLSQAWGLEEFGLGQALMSVGRRFVLVGAGADMGPGLNQVYQRKFGSPDLEFNSSPVSKHEALVMYGPCSSHGVVNIQKAACELKQGDADDEDSPSDYLEEVISLLFLLKKRCQLENIQSAINIPFPRTFRSKKWTSLKQTLEYFLNNWGKFIRLEGTTLDIITGGDEDDESEERTWNWTSFYDMLSVFGAVMEPLCSLSVSLQTVGPLDGYVMVMSVLKALTALHRKDFYIAKLGESGVTEFVPLVFDHLRSEQKEVFTSLQPCVELMKKRLVRRFFYNSLGSTIGRHFAGGAEDVDRTFKYDYLQCSTVLGLFALSPYSDFRFLATEFPGVANESEIDALAKCSKSALWLLFKSRFGVEKTKTVATLSSGMVKRQRGHFGSGNQSDDGGGEEAARRDFFASVAILNAKKELDEICMEFDSSAETREDRVKFFKSWLGVANSVDKRLGTLLSICASQLLSNAVGEGNFSSVTRFLSAQRLKTGGKLLAAQLLAGRAGTWAQFKDPEIRGKKAKPGGPMDAFMKSKPAALPLGRTEPMEVVEVEDGEEESDVGETDGDQPQQTSSTTSAATTTTTATSSTTAAQRPQRANRGNRMEAIMRVLYSESSGRLEGGTAQVERIAEEGDEEEYTE